MVKLTDDEVQDIIDNRADLSLRQLAFRYNVSHQTISNIQNKQLKSLEDNKSFKVIGEDRKYIKEQRGKKTHIELALQFNVSWRQIYNIWNEDTLYEDLPTFDDYYEERQYKTALKRKLVAERKKKLIEKRKLNKKK